MRDKIYLAALLHDIGKFYQRADDKENRKFRFLKDHFWNSPGTYCPEYKGRYSHKHVLWTAQFIEEHREVFAALNADLTQGDDSLERLAALHHNPGTKTLGKIIQLADHYSSATDRDHDAYSLEDGLKDDDWLNFKKRRMVPVFEGIHNEKQTYSWKLPVNELSLDREKYFPKDDKLPDPDYLSLWNKFVEEFKRLPRHSITVFSESLLYLLEKYTVTIPSSTQHLPDVSLYDHSKTTAALAVAIYDFYIEQGRLPEKKSKEEKPVLLIGADISGIQKFIYDIISKNAAKNLKGRSFFLQLMTDSIIRKLLKELKLFSANVVYSSGGGFFIIAPNTEFVRDKLKEFEGKLLDKLFEHYKLKLYVAMDAVPISSDLLLKADENNNLSTVWAELISLLNAKKRQRYASKMANGYVDFFEPVEQGGESSANRDAITGEEIPKGKRKELNGEPVSLDTYLQVELGKDLKKAKYWLITEEKLPANQNANVYNPLDLGIYHYFLEKDSQLTNIPEGALVLTINDTANDALDSRMKYAAGFRFYGGNYYPSDENGFPKTFDKLVGEGEFKRLGILRMDVDNLGQIFISGFSNRKRTFSRYSSLSRNLDYFFTGYLNKLQQPYRDNSYILYAGGDDLFVLGKWDELIAMARKIRDEFSAWVCRNEHITLSGGISFVGGKFPILKAAKEAEEEESNAKEYKNKNLGQEKNAFSLFGKALSWDEHGEMKAVEELKSELLYFLKDEILPKSFISKIYAFTELREKQTENEMNESWQWQMAYHLSRFAGNRDDLKKFIERVKVDVFVNSYYGKKQLFNYHYLELLRIAARWAELEYRTKK